MSKNNKYENLTPEEIEEIREIQRTFKEVTQKVNGIKGFKKNSHKYRMEKGMALKLKAAALIILAAAGGIVGLSPNSRAENLAKEKEVCTLATIVSENPQQIPTMEIDGVKVEIDLNSIALVDGKIEEGENYTITYNNSGNKLEGNIDSKNLKGNIEISKEELDDYVIYQVISEEGAELIQKEETTTNISYGNFVVGKEEHKEFIEVLYPNGKDILRGKVDERTLEIVNEISIEQYKMEEHTKRVINTSEDKYADLSFRSSPNEEKYSIMMKIPNGTVVNITEETATENGRHWTKVEYEGKLGWVATEYLDEFIREEEQNAEKIEEPEYIENTGIKNASGNVTGIDVSSINPNQLEALLKNGMPIEVIAEKVGNINTYGVAGNINFVHIKLGASPYGKGEFKPTDYNEYEEIVKVCEELGIPYGFYYYSTAINIDEAEIEANHIKNTVEQLRDKYDMKYNILPMTIDKELTGVHDRQYGKDITDATAYLLNRMNFDEISQKVLLYISGRMIDENDSDRVIDLERLKAEVTDLEDFAIWLCAPTTKKGYTTQSTVNYCNMIEDKYGIKIASKQIALDVYSPDGGKIDINNMDYEYYNEIIKELEANTFKEDTEAEYEER